MDVAGAVRRWLVPTIMGASLAGALPTATASTIVAVDRYPLPTADAGPYDIAAGPDGHLWFTESDGNKIGRITTRGQVTEYDLSAGSTPAGLTPGPDGTIWFANQERGSIGAITTRGVLAGEQPIRTPEARPTFVTAGPDGSLWFTELGASKVGRITPLGELVEYDLPSIGAGPTGIAAGPDGNVWVAEQVAGRIARITPAGEITEHPLPEGARPFMIAPGPDGNLWFTDQGRNRISTITPDGFITEYALPTPNASPWGIVAGLDGNLWFTEYLAGAIGRITPAGVITEYDLPVAETFPSAIAVGPDGHLWYTEYRGNAIGKLTLGPDLVQVHGDGTVTASVETAISISATPSVSFRTLAIGETAIAAPNPASVRVTTNSSGYTLGVSRTPFTGGADIPLTVSVTAPPLDLFSGAFAFTPLTGPTTIPTDGTLTVGARLSGSAMTGDEWTPVYRIGPIPLRPSGPTSSVITYTAVAQ